jgi:hypothetical protein
VAEALPAGDIPDDALRCPAFALASMMGQGADQGSRGVP